MIRKYIMKPLVILTGPTAVGKTDLSINLAKRINGEIISADSAQVYKGLDIGSAKITSEEMQGVPHHLIDVYEPDESFDVTVFQKEAERIIGEIYERGRIPIIVGGTGFYIQSVLYDISFDPEDGEDSGNEDGNNGDEKVSNEPINSDKCSDSADIIDTKENTDNTDNTDNKDNKDRIDIKDIIDNKGIKDIRKYLENYYDETGDKERLYNILLEVDPESAAIIHMNNVRKVIRALEFYYKHGYKISDHNKEQHEKTSVYNSAYFVLTMDRTRLYERINMRVDIMKNSGLIDEVYALYNRSINENMTSMQAIGYKEIYEAIKLAEEGGIEKGSREYDELFANAFEKIKLNTRHFAKRQLTWFRREKDVIWLDKDKYDSEDALLDEMILCLNEKNILHNPNQSE